MDRFTVAIAKGRVFEAMKPVWRAVGWEWPKVAETRALWFPPQQGSPGIIIARGPDIPTLVRSGAAAYGVVGYDILAEQVDHGTLEVLDLGTARCRMALAGRHPEWPQGPARVATKYPRSAAQFFRQHHYPVEIIPMSGSLEIAPSLGIAPFIVDLVQTGSTLRAHGLTEIVTLYHSSARLVANAGMWRTATDGHYIFSQMQRVVAEGEEAQRGGEVVGHCGGNS